MFFYLEHLGAKVKHFFLWYGKQFFPSGQNHLTARTSGQRTLSQRDKLTGECYGIVLSGTLLTLELSPDILWNWTLLDFGFFTKHTLDWMVGK